MELTQLKYFLAAANCGRIAQAAEMLQISQSAISMAITRLEKEVGVRLFEKQGRCLRLTANGARFVELITPAIAELDFAQKHMQNIDREEPDTITLSVEMPDFAMVLENIYCRLRPSTRFRQAMDTTESARQKLLCESVDFCLSFEPFPSPDTVSVCVLTEPVLVQLQKSHPLAGREGIFLKELAETPFASFSPEYSFRRWTDTLCYRAGFRPQIRFEACDTQSLLMMVRLHGAAALVAQSSLELYNARSHAARLAREEVAAVPLLDDGARRSVYLSYHKNRILSADAKAFWGFALCFKDGMERFGSIMKTEEDILSGN